MESKIAERINHEISGAPFAVYRMIPAFNGADIIGVTTIEKFEEVMRLFNEIEHVQEFLDSQPDKSKTIVLPGIELPIGIAINKARGAVIDHSIEVELSNEGYLIVE